MVELPSPKSQKQYDYLTTQVDVMVFGGGRKSSAAYKPV